MKTKIITTQINQLNRFTAQYMTSLDELTDGIEERLDEVLAIINLVRECKGNVWLVGNGGSFALASHMATDLQLAGVPAMVLGDATSYSSYANDNGVENVFSKQVTALVRKEDLVILISTSGNSLNVIRAAKWAHAIGATTLGIVGNDGGLLVDNVTYMFAFESPETGPVQDAQQVLLHLVAYYLMLTV